MAVTLFLRIPAEERAAYERKGWTWVRDLWSADRKQCLVKKDVRK